MEKKKNCSYPMHFSEAVCFKEQGTKPPFPRPGCFVNDNGWILAFVLLLLLVIQGLAVAALSMVKHQLKSSAAFYQITKGNHFSSRSGETPVGTQFQLAAPEGWDHTLFSTELNEILQGNEQCYSWRVYLSESSRSCTDDVMLSSARPYIIIIVDDSDNMNKSSGSDYKDPSLYLKSSTGEIVHVSDVSEITSTTSVTYGTYFIGRYGNAYFKAPALGALTGAMPEWAHAYSYAKSLSNSLELCETAVMSTSRGTIQGFTHDHKMINSALEGIHPSSSEARLAEALYKASNMFPKECITDRHILLVTSGVAINDGHVPDLLKDFDHDGNPDDTAVPGEGSHCADDVSAYAFSKGIKVHVVGPDTTFLRRVAAKGGGNYMPGRDSFAPSLPFVCQAMVLQGGGDLLPVHNLARFDPSWLMAGTSTSFRLGIINPASLVACPGLIYQGLAKTLTPHGPVIFCTTSGDNLLKISLPSGELHWMVAGIGGTVIKKSDKIIAGPNSSGTIFCLDDQPSVQWTARGEHFDVSDSGVYIAEGSSITARSLGTGAFFASADTGHEITSLRYDPSTGMVLAGTREGLIFLYSREFESLGIITTGIDVITDIRPFTYHKKACIVALGRKSVVCSTIDERMWSISIDEGTPVGCIIMDKKVYLNTWQEGGPCGGIDTGSSSLVILDAVTGEHIGTKYLFSGKAFGPTIDLTGKRLVYTSWNGFMHEEDISGLTGITWYPAGRRIVRPFM